MICDTLEEIRSFETSFKTTDSPNLGYLYQNESENNSKEKVHEKTLWKSNPIKSEIELLNLTDIQRGIKPKTPAEYWKNVDIEYRNWHRKFQDIFASKHLWELNAEEFEEFLQKKGQKSEDYWINYVPDHLKPKSFELVRGKIDFELPETSFLPLNTVKDIIAVTLKSGDQVFFLKYFLNGRTFMELGGKLIYEDSYHNRQTPYIIDDDSETRSNHFPDLQLNSFQKINSKFWEDIEIQNGFLKMIQNYLDLEIMNPINLEILSIGSLILNSSHQKDFKEKWELIKIEALNEKKNERTIEQIEKEKKFIL